jgi:hypothetical protein
MDHILLVIALSRVTAPISSRQKRHLAYVSQFNVQMLYWPGLKNVVVDFLVSHPQPTGEFVAAAADFELMAVKQNRSPEMRRFLGGSSLTIAYRQAGTQHLVCDIFTDVFHPVVPEKF